MKLYLFAFALSILGVVFADFSPRCRSPTPVKELKESTEKMCMGTWYAYALSNQCDDCCFVRKLTQIKPGVVSLTQTLKKPGDSSAAVMEAIVEKDPDAVIYRINGTNPVAILAVDCNNYIVSYNMDTNMMAIFTRQLNPNQSDLKVAKQVATRCHMRLFRYNMTGC